MHMLDVTTSFTMCECEVHIQKLDPRRTYCLCRRFSEMGRFYDVNSLKVQLQSHFDFRRKKLLIVIFTIITGFNFIVYLLNL